MRNFSKGRIGRLSRVIDKTPGGRYRWTVIDELGTLFGIGDARTYTEARRLASERLNELKNRRKEHNGDAV